jgi:hypothetical protein
MHSNSGKIRIGRQWLGKHHRSGWAYAIDAIQHLDSDHGVLFDGILDKKFVFGGDPGDRHNGLAPYREPWIGFLHNPPYVPPTFGRGRSAEDILGLPQWRESLPYCRGLFTLSKYLGDWLAPRVAAPVCSLVHPTESCAVRFSMERYCANPDPMLVHVGWWLRRFHSFFELPTQRLGKLLLHLDTPWVNRVIAAEMALVKGAPRYFVQNHLENCAYDELLSRNIVFLDLYDSSANNAIIECVARQTPVVVNRLAAVCEYLGADYPLYFDTLEEAARLAEDDDRVHAAHVYLRDHEELRERLTADRFAAEFTGSAIYQGLG